MDDNKMIDNQHRFIELNNQSDKKIGQKSEVQPNSRMIRKTSGKGKFLENDFLILGLVLAIILGGFVRIVHIINLDIPLNDGGLFYQMILDLQSSFYKLPQYTTYNHAKIPFAYPPMPFYLSGYLSDSFGWDLLDIIRVLPVIISILTIPAFFQLCKKILTNKWQISFATFAFALIPTAFDWLIVGGGLTRSFGYLFAILALSQIYSLFTKYQKRNIFLAILFSSLTVLSHPGTTWFVIFSTGIILIFNLKKKIQLINILAIVSSGVLVLTAPWWGTVIRYHDTSVFLYPFQTESLSGASILTPFTFLFTNEPLLDTLAFLGLIGVWVCLRDQKYMLPIWLFSVFLFESRLGATYAVVPMVMLSGIGLNEILTIIQLNSQKITNLRIIVLSHLLLLALIAALLAPKYSTVSENQISVMAWIQANTPESSQFMVITSVSEYGIDPVSEWFPVLSQRTSLTVPQGYEWLPNAQFLKRQKLHADLQACAKNDVSCIESFAAQNKLDYTHIYIASAGKWLISTITKSPNFDLEYDGFGGLIFSRK
ncbi:MAG: hypothetical protein ABFS03_01790 [Chloroflexota bacterium]